MKTARVLQRLVAWTWLVFCVHVAWALAPHAKWTLTWRRLSWSKWNTWA